jgi:ubiquinone biosynthesis UbiH/UbiF/VisC/COQ6 family hydroxylase
MMTGHVIVVGAGPAALSFARAMSRSAARITLVERQPLTALAQPAPDGREIALTHKSVRILRDLGVWPLLPRAEVHPLREARVLNGGNPFALSLGAGTPGTDGLGVLVSNHLIRKALFESVAGQSNVSILPATEVEQVFASATRAQVRLGDGTSLTGDLLVAADARLSVTRNQLGIGARIHPLGRTMIVCRVRHPEPHHQVATEWFDHHRTVAMLPLDPGRSSLVLTLPEPEARALTKLDLADLGAAFDRYTRLRWGGIQAEEAPFAYPLTITYADEFATARAALIGDAAVGMHPVTAHGFNFGLMSAVRLARLIRNADDVGDPRRLGRYASAHRAATWPLYQATRMLVGLFTDERPLARLTRNAVLRLGAMTPARRGMERLLTGSRTPRL